MSRSSLMAVTAILNLFELISELGFSPASLGLGLGLGLELGFRISDSGYKLEYVCK